MIKFRINSRMVFNVPLCLFFLEMKYGGKHLIRRITRASHRRFHSDWRQDLYLCGCPHKGISGKMSITVTKSRYLEGRIGFFEKKKSVRRDTRSRNLPG